MLRRALVALVLGVLVVGLAGPAPADSTRKVPSREQWVKDVNKAMKGSGGYLKERLAEGGEGLAVNLDIDNSSLTSYYDGDDATAIPRVKRFTNRATANGVVLLFNTGRLGTKAKRAYTLEQLTEAGYDVTVLCMRKKGETLVQGKQRCRDSFAAQGYTLIANIGNNPTDFAGDGYERAFTLPNYGGRLG